jgi:AcrR family transcriptional regulator
MARTQQQRREDTIAGLLDASIETIIEVGYARASAKVITQRAQVSDGALFRHFPTMGDFMAATAQEAGRRQLDEIAKRMATLPADASVDAFLAIMRDLASNPTNTVLHELMVAARTDEMLRAPLRDVLAVYVGKIYEAARSAFSAEEISEFGEENFATLVAVLINSFDGAAIAGQVLASHDIEERRIPMVASLLNSARSRGLVANI